MVTVSGSGQTDGGKVFMCKLTSDIMSAAAQSFCFNGLAWKFRMSSMRFSVGAPPNSTLRGFFFLISPGLMDGLDISSSLSNGSSFTNLLSFSQAVLKSGWYSIQDFCSHLVRKSAILLAEPGKYLNLICENLMRRAIHLWILAHGFSSFAR